MKNRISKTLLAGAVVSALVLAGCSGTPENKGSDTGELSGSIDVFVSMTTGSPLEKAMKAAVAKFQQDKGVTVNLTSASATYEADMKVKMASDSVPDVFSTHGWSVLRYSPFLMQLDDQPWAKNVNPGLKNVMYDAQGHIYALPLEYGTAGLLVNYEILEKLGIDVKSLETWEGLDAALAKVKAANLIPLTSGGKESNSGDIANFIASGQFTKEQNQAFSNGTFDPKLWQTGVSDRIEKWQKAGYFNPDFVSASLDDMSRQLADGSAAFGIGWPFVVGTAYEYNPKAKLGFVPLPGVNGPFLVGGEGVSSFGVSKTSKNQKAALAFISFLAEPANAKPILEATGAYSGLTDVKVDLGPLQPSFDKYVAPGEIPTMPFFDRVYLPNGMWDTIITTTNAVITGQSTSAKAAEGMAEQFKTLYGQQKK